MARTARRNMKSENTHRVANPEHHKAMLGLRMSSAAQPHKDRRTRRARTRSSEKAKAIVFAS